MTQKEHYAGKDQNHQTTSNRPSDEKHDMTDLMKDLNDLDEHAIQTLAEAAVSGDGVNLPFAAPYVYVYNGDRRNKANAKDAPALYFGGWAVDEASLTEMVDSGDLPGLPDGWARFENSGDKGDYTGLCSRTVTAAILARRERWINQASGQSAPSFDRDGGYTRRHRQWLGLMFIKGKPYGFAVLSAKGYQAQEVQTAIDAWHRAIGKFRKELNATQIPPSAFAVTIGTHGDQPEYVPVGKSGAQSNITPIRAILAPDLTADMIAKRFIGAQNLRACAERVEQAREWLVAWKAPSGKASNGQAGEPETPPEVEYPF